MHTRTLTLEWRITEHMSPARVQGSSPDNRGLTHTIPFMTSARTYIFVLYLWLNVLLVTCDAEESIENLHLCDSGRMEQIAFK